ncbi:hypothetical protein D3OALGB2SA_3709, partial [Olavius algarvensis associated proteobacterium Delta 3]
APAGAVTMFEFVVEIVPNVTGEVVEVPVKPFQKLKKDETLFQIDPVPFEFTLKQLQASLKKAEASKTLATVELKRNRAMARQSAAAQREVDTWQARYDEAVATIESIQQQINQAEWNLEQTTVRAPSDGYVVGVTLRPGQRVSNLPLRSWMAFVKEEESKLVAGINQNMMRYVQPGQKAEVVFKLFPGKVFNATVESLYMMNPQGQLQASGIVPMAPTTQQLPLPFGVILNLDEDLPEFPVIPGGAMGTAAIYTSNVRATHMIRKVMIRMEAWINYINPY